jgi:predicted kinase
VNGIRGGQIREILNDEQKKKFEQYLQGPHADMHGTLSGATSSPQPPQNQGILHMKTPRHGARLIIVCGLPGSGKTTHARQLQTRLRAIRLCPDEWMDALSLEVWDEGRREKIENLQWQLGQQLLNLGLTVIIEWGTWGRSERDALRLRARELGAAVELHYLSAPVEILLDRIQRRGMESPAVQREQLLQWASAFQAPTAEELTLFDRVLTLEAPG